MTRLYYMPDPATRFVADFDGSDAPLLSRGAHSGHPAGCIVSAVDFQAGTYRIRDEAIASESEMTIPPRWFDVDDDGTPPVLIIHDGDTVVRVPFVNAEDDPAAAVTDPMVAFEEWFASACGQQPLTFKAGAWRAWQHWAAKEAERRYDDAGEAACNDGDAP